MIRKAPHTLLRWSLLCGAIYFALICVAHLFGFKIPMFFIYYNIPSYIYQDLIIAFLSFGWAMFFYSGYKSTKVNELVTAKYIIIAGFGAITGLIVINSSTNFKVLMEQAKASHFWIETGILFLYPGWLLFLFILAKQKKIVPDTENPFKGIPKPTQPNYSSEQEMYARKWR